MALTFKVYNFSSKALTVLFLGICYLAITDAQNCGIVGTAPDSEIVLPPLADTLPPGVEIWRTATYNVTGTTAVPHPHYKYITALRLSRSYYFETNDVYPSFMETEKTDIIVRDVTFNCNDGGTANYYFKFPIEISDKEKPTFLETEYAFEITEDFPLINKAINQGVFIIVRDADIELVDADLAFNTTLPLNIKIVGTKLWNGDPPKGHFYYSVDLFLIEPLSVGSYSFDINAYSRFQLGSARVNLIVK